MRFAPTMPPGKNVQILPDGFTIRKTVSCYGLEKLEFMRALCSHLIRNPNPQVVPIYRFKELMKSKHLISYEYDMMRLGILSQTEEAFIDEVGALYDCHGKDAFAVSGDGKFLSVEKDFPKLFSFMKDLCHQYRYYDIHSGNIMIDSEGNYRVIDLEGFIRFPLSSKENDWITKE